MHSLIFRMYPFLKLEIVSLLCKAARQNLAKYGKSLQQALSSAEPFNCLTVADKKRENAACSISHGAPKCRASAEESAQQGN